MRAVDNTTIGLLAVWLGQCDFKYISESL